MIENRAEVGQSSTPPAALSLPASKFIINATRSSALLGFKI